MNADKTRNVIGVYLRLSAAIMLFATGCGRYANFALPETAGGDQSIVFRFLPEPEPVLTRDEFRDALNPSVVGGINLYSVYDGQWHTALATSRRRRALAEAGHCRSGRRRAATSPPTAAHCSHQGQYWYWYETGTKDHLRISLARSADARAWQTEPAPVLDVGPSGAWDERAVADPYAIRIGEYFYMYYLGQDRAVRQRIGVARSTDGVHWEKLRANPVLEMDDDEAGIGEPAVWQSHGFYWMLYTVRDFTENRYLRLARSTDGVHWTKLAPRYTGDAGVELQSHLRPHRGSGWRSGESLVRRRRRCIAR